VDIMGISEQPEKHGGHHGGELIPTLFIDMKDDPDCQTTPQKEIISYIAGFWTLC